MRNPLLALLSTGIITQKELFPELPDEANGMPTVTDASCTGCGRCAAVCPLQAITLGTDAIGTTVALDRGRCLGCQECVRACNSGTIIPDRSTRIATRTRAELVRSNRPSAPATTATVARPFQRSIHIREVSTGDNAADLELIACTNAVFDLARFGIHIVASPRYADALFVTGAVGRAMQEPLRRCYEAMAEPRLVIAVGTSAISGAVFAGDYAEANGVTNILPIAAYVPGDPPNPWSIIHGIMLAMGHPAAG
ncbi:MAG: 4Fe-4S dicluster domain-containing protein [bacterium]